MRIYSFLSFLIPFPLFIDLASGAFVIHSVDYDVMLTEVGVPIPIGLAAMALIILFSFLRVVRLRLNKDVALTIACLTIFSFIASNQVDALKLLAVQLPIVLLLFFSATVSQPRIVEKIFKGYLVGVLFQIWLHASSIILYSLDVQSLFSLSRSFFGYEIYQAWISYSAVLSAAGAAAVIYALSLTNLSSRPLIFMLVIPIYFIVILASRKAAMVDLAIVFLINVFFMLRSFGSLKKYMISKQLITNVLIFFMLSFAALMFESFSPREISYDDAMEQRSGAYEIFVAELSNLNWFQIMTGYAPGWGGYSNFFVELMARSGLLGMLPFLLSLVIATRYVFLSLFVQGIGGVGVQRFDIYIKCWFAFALGSFLVGNLFNMNVQLPYYTVNFLMINVCFVFYRTQYLRNKARIFEARRL